MKLLVVCGSINLGHRFATTQYYWQLLKGLYENGADTIVIPYVGYAIESLWWRTYQNPCAVESLAVNYIMDKFSVRSASKKGSSSLVLDKYIKPKWTNHLLKILRKEQNVDAIVYLGVPFNHLNGIPTKIRQEFKIPFLHFDGDYPTSLPVFFNAQSFKFDSYNGADLSEFDVMLSNAICAVEPLYKMGAKNVRMLLYGVDPDVCSPLDLEKTTDVFYSGIRSAQKEKQMEYMIGVPSLALVHNKFVVGLKDKDKVDLGIARKVGIVPMSEWRNFICSSKIALNITKSGDAALYGTSSMRPFELASMGSCVVSDPYNGLNEWFDIGKEMFIVHNAKEATDIYKTLLSDDKLRTEVGQKARARVVKDHSTKVRAKELVGYINEFKTKTNNNRT
jgi:glycosyltransferase involved in cell wall biosynthesis